MTAARPAQALVVDASVAAKWHLRDEEYSAVAVAVLQRFVEGDLELIAPDQIRYEVASSITVATLGRQSRLTREQGQDAIVDFLSYGVLFESDDGLILDAYGLVHQYGCAIYDALYVALAARRGIDVITADAKLYQRVKSLPFVIWIGDYSQLG